MKIIIISIALLLLGVKIYFDYAQSDESKVDKQHQNILTQEKKNIETDVVDDESEEEKIENEIDQALAKSDREDIAVKDSIVEDIPLEEREEEKDEQEAMSEETNEDIAVKDAIEETVPADMDKMIEEVTPADMERMIEEQEALIHESVTKEDATVENKSVEEAMVEESSEQPLDDGAKERLAEKDKMKKRDELMNKVESDEERIIKEEEEKIKSAIEEG